MNPTTLLIGLACGAVSAVLSIALSVGSMLSLVLFLFAPLPVFIAALGWRHHAGLIATVTGTLLLFALLGFDVARSYALSVGVPAWWLGYLALLGRPLDAQHPDRGMLWYPIGRLATWAACIGAALVLTSIAVYGGSVEDYRAALKSTFEQFLRAEMGTAQDAPLQLPGGGDATRATELAVIALPPMAAAMWTAVSLINLWAAGRIVRISGRLVRPWPDLAAFTLPRLTLATFALCMLGASASGLLGFAAGVIAASFAVIFTALGLALMHYSTRGKPARPLMLTIVYFILAVQTWLLIIVAAFGMVEHLFGLRARMGARNGQPPNTLNS